MSQAGRQGVGCFSLAEGKEGAAGGPRYPSWGLGAKSNTELGKTAGPARSPTLGSPQPRCRSAACPQNAHLHTQPCFTACSWDKQALANSTSDFVFQRFVQATALPVPVPTPVPTPSLFRLILSLSPFLFPSQPPSHPLPIPIPNTTPIPIPSQPPFPSLSLPPSHIIPRFLFPFHPHS